MPTTEDAVTGTDTSPQKRRVPSKQLSVRFGRNVIYQREKRGWPQEELARRCKMKYPFLSAIERGRSNATLATIETLAKALGCSEAALLERRSER